MVLILHVTIAVLGLFTSALCYVNPTANKLKAVFGLTALTLASGTYLVISTRSHLVSACLSGLAYISLAAVGIYLSKVKMQKQKSR